MTERPFEDGKSEPINSEGTLFVKTELPFIRGLVLDRSEGETILIGSIEIRIRGPFKKEIETEQGPKVLRVAKIEVVGSVSEEDSERETPEFVEGESGE